MITRSRRGCRNCLCRSCLKSCKCQECQGKVSKCRKYAGFRQVSIFEPQKPRYHRAPRHSWEHYGISKERYRKLTDMIRSGRYTSLAQSAAHTASKDIAEYILLSVMKNKSYEGVEYAEGLGRIPCGRTDFYGIRRYFYYLFDKEMKKNGISNVED